MTLRHLCPFQKGSACHVADVIGEHSDVPTRRGSRSEKCAAKTLSTPQTCPRVQWVQMGVDGIILMTSNHVEGKVIYIMMV